MTEAAPRQKNHRKIKTLLTLFIFVVFTLFIMWNIGAEKFFKYLLLGLPQGGIIALIAIGYSMVYGIVQLINFAHGEVFMISAYLVFTFACGSGIIPQSSLITLVVLFGFISLPSFKLILETKINSARHNFSIASLASIIFAFALYYFLKMKSGFFTAWLLAVLLTSLLGVAMDQYCYKPLRKSPRLVPLITAIGISLFLANLAQNIWSSQSRAFPAEILPGILSVPYTIDGQFLTADKISKMPIFELLLKGHRLRISSNIIIPLVDVIIFFLAALLMIVVQVFLLKTKTGKAMRACSQDLQAAKLMGVNVDRIISFTFALGSALAALCSPLYVMKYAPLEPSMGYIVGILAFASAVLGGIGNIPGAMLGGFCIGIIYNFVPIFETLSTWKVFVLLKSSGMFSNVESWNFLSGITQWRLGIAFTFMLIVILVKPQGLLGAVEAKKRA